MNSVTQNHSTSLYKQLEQEKESISAKKKFISLICHELRNPLHTISLSSNLLNKFGDRWETAKQKKYLSRIMRSVDTINLLIDEWLILEKAEVGKLDVKLEAFNIEVFCNNLLSDIQLDSFSETENTEHITKQQKINFIYSGDSLSILTDRRMLQLILTNLLENALKYSPEDTEIDFIVNSKTDYLYFRVIDRGIGIKTADLQYLFEPFFRGENIDNIDGHGLGLTIIKKLVDLLDGEILVNSQEGLGTEFMVTFPKIIAR